MDKVWRRWSNKWTKSLVVQWVGREFIHLELFNTVYQIGCFNYLLKCFFVSAIVTEPVQPFKRLMFSENMLKNQRKYYHDLYLRMIERKNLSHSTATLFLLCIYATATKSKYSCTSYITGAVYIRLDSRPHRSGFPTSWNLKSIN